MSDAVQLQRRLRVALQNDDYEAAIACLKEAAGLARDAGDRAAVGRHLGNLALIYNRAGQPEAALHCFEQALALARAEGDRLTEDGLLGNMGNILREMGRSDEAREYLTAALHLAQEIGDVRGRGIWLSNLALVYDDLGQPRRAIDYHTQAIVVARQLHDQRGLASRLRKLSDSFLAANSPAEALKCLGEALTIYTSMGDQRELMNGLMTGARIHILLAEAAHHPQETRLFLQNAVEYDRHALALAHETADHAAEMQILIHIGDALAGLGDDAAAQRCFQTARRLAVILDLADWQAATAERLGQFSAHESQAE